MSNDFQEDNKTKRQVDLELKKRRETISQTTTNTAWPHIMFHDIVMTCYDP